MLALAVALPWTTERVVADANDAKSCSRFLQDIRKWKPVPCDQQLAGQWNGQLTETRGNTYLVEIFISENPSIIKYPGLKCSGTLAFKERRGETYVFGETITKGTKCGKTADVELTPASGDGATVDFNWIGRGTKVTGQLSGLMTAGATDFDGSRKSKSDDDENDCLKFLPNRGTVIRVPCEQTERRF